MLDTLSTKLSIERLSKLQPRDSGFGEALLFGGVALAISVGVLLLKYYLAAFYNRSKRGAVKTEPLYSSLDSDGGQPAVYLPASYLHSEEVINDNHRMHTCFFVTLVLLSLGISSAEVAGVVLLGVFCLLYLLLDCLYTPFALLKRKSPGNGSTAFNISCVLALTVAAFALAGAIEISVAAANFSLVASALVASAWAALLLLLLMLAISTYNRRHRLIDEQPSSLYSEPVDLTDDSAAAINQPPADVTELCSANYLVGEQLADDIHRSNIAFAVSMIFLVASISVAWPNTLNAVPAYVSLYVIFQFIYAALTLLKPAFLSYEQLRFASLIVSATTTFINVFFTLWGSIAFIVLVSNV